MKPCTPSREMPGVLRAGVAAVLLAGCGSAAPSPRYYNTAAGPGSDSTLSSGHADSSDFSTGHRRAGLAPAAQSPRRVVIVAAAPGGGAAGGATYAVAPAPPTSPQVASPNSFRVPGVEGTDSLTPSSPRDMGAVAGSLRTLEDRIARGESALSTASSECGSVCRAASDICVAAREVCELTDAAGASLAGGDARCDRARAACERAARQRETACPVCPST